jgi:hypothetical protein
MSGTGKGFAIALAMLIGALSLTSLLAAGLQRHAASHQSTVDYSPTMDAIVDPSGWPRVEKSQTSEAPREPGRSRLPPTSSDSGA